MRLAIELVSPLDSQVSGRLFDTSMAMDIDSPQVALANPFSTLPKHSSTIIHRYYSYILFATIKLFPMKGASNKQDNMRTIEAPKPEFSQRSERETRIDYDKFSMDDDILLPQKRKDEQYSFPTKHTKLSYYNDVMSF